MYIYTAYISRLDIVLMLTQESFMDMYFVLLR